jgi:hypothetical protein
MIEQSVDRAIDSKALCDPAEIDFGRAILKTDALA